MTEDIGQSIDTPASLSFAFPPQVTIETVESIADMLKKNPMTEKALLTLDISQVEYITTPGLQLIISLQKAILALGGVMQIIGAKQTISHVFQQAGLERLLLEKSHNIEEVH